MRKCSSWSLEFLLSSFRSQLWANSIVGLQWSLWIQTPSLHSYHTLRSTEEKHIWWIVSDFFLTMFDYPKPSHQHNKSAKSTRKSKILPSMDQGSLENCWVLDNFSESGKQTIDACVWEIQRSIVEEEAPVCITPPHACTFFQPSSVTLQLQGK